MSQAKRIIVAGATGLIGKKICYRLIKDGYEVIVLARDITKAQQMIPDAAAYIHYEATEALSQEVLQVIDGSYAVVNVTGRSIFVPFKGKRYLNKLTDERIEITQHIVYGMKSVKNKPKLFICASSVGPMVLEI